MSDYASGGVLRPSTATPLSLADCGLVAEPTDADRLSYDVTVRWPDGRTLITVSATELPADVAAALREVAAIIERVQ
jgi:hypothetical protein